MNIFVRIIITIFLINILFLSCDAAKNYKQSQLKYEASYGTEKIKTGKRHYKYLKFYKDKLAIGVVAMDEPNEINKWFNRDSNSVGKGQFEIKNNIINFSLISTNGKVDYEGEINEDGTVIIIKSFSHINKQSHIIKYYLLN